MAGEIYLQVYILFRSEIRHITLRLRTHAADSSNEEIIPNRKVIVTGCFGPCIDAHCHFKIDSCLQEKGS